MPTQCETTVLAISLERSQWVSRGSNTADMSGALAVKVSFEPWSDFGAGVDNKWPCGLSQVPGDPYYSTSMCVHICSLHEVLA